MIKQIKDSFNDISNTKAMWILRGCELLGILNRITWVLNVSWGWIDITGKQNCYTKKKRKTLFRARISIYHSSHVDLSQKSVSNINLLRCIKISTLGRIQDNIWQSGNLNEGSSKFITKDNRRRRASFKGNIQTASPQFGCSRHKREGHRAVNSTKSLNSNGSYLVMLGAKLPLWHTELYAEQ